MTDDPQIQKADPRARRGLVLWTLAAVGLGAALALWAPDVSHWVTADPARSIARLNLMIGGLLLPAALVVGASYRIWQIGQAARRAQRYPPPGFPVVRDTRVLAGAAAQRRGRHLQIFAWLMVGLALLPPVVLWWLVWRLLGGGAG